MRPQTQEDFVRAVMDKLGLSQTELGVKLRKPNAYQQVHGWLTGRAKLAYEDTLAMLEMCGWLDVGGADVTPIGELPNDRLSALEALVAQLPTAEDLGVAVETLRAAIDRLANADTRAGRRGKLQAPREQQL